MLTIREYTRPQTLDEAYELCQKRANVVLGGMLWLKMQQRNVGTAIDLCDLGLDTITEDEQGYTIGAMVPLRALEQHPGLNKLTGGAFAEAMRGIVGVQFRNVATVGGSVFGRYGFSDVVTLFLALGATVKLHHAGPVAMEQFIARPLTERDILVSVYLPKTVGRCVYLSQRNATTDFPVCTCALTQSKDGWRCAVGARPMPAVLLSGPAPLLEGEFTPQNAAAFGREIAQCVTFGGNRRAGAEYRRRVCAVLASRAALALGKED